MSEIRDPIYGFILPSDNELRIINTKIFQRLRRIRQLAMEYLVYPTAHHTRFEHSLGVFHIASLVADKLLPGTSNKDKRDLIRLSALLHDVGHGPFSHTSEEVLDKYAVLAGATKTEKIHELITTNLIKYDSEMKKLLSPEQIDGIIGLLQGTKVDLSLMRQIVSGPLDADKMDYLLRDSYCCGVKYGIFDLERMLNSLSAIDEKWDKHLGIKSDGVNMLEQYFLAKYYMITQVYFHKIRRVSDAMIVRGLELGIDKDDNEDLKRIFCYKDEGTFFEEYLDNWDDRVIIKLVYSNKESYAKDIFTRLYNRNLFKRVFSKNINEIIFKKETARDNLININRSENSKSQKELEDIIAKSVLKCQEEYVILRVTRIKSVKEMARDGEGSILILNDDFGPPSTFEQESTIFGAINEKLKDIIVEVYAPVEYRDDRDKSEKRLEYEKPIIEILAS